MYIKKLEDGRIKFYEAKGLTIFELLARDYGVEIEWLEDDAVLVLKPTFMEELLRWYELNEI